MNWIDIFQSIGIFFLALACAYNTKHIGLLRDFLFKQLDALYGSIGK